MGDPKGFLTLGRVAPEKRPVSERVGDFREFIALHKEGSAAAQGGRCMDCGVPFCMQGCPLGNRIPDFNGLVHTDHWRRAYVALRSTNNFPEFTGRLCPAPCEAACVLAVNDEAVTIEQIEKEVIERAFSEGWVVAEPPRTRSGKRVAVVGSGPAGLAAAAQLNRAGHLVVVFEKRDQVGGLLRYGIPDFKMEKSVIDRRVAILEAEGVVFKTGITIGADVSWNELKVGHDAVVVAIGAERPRELTVEGRELGGVHVAMDYLVEQNQVVAGATPPEPRVSAAGKRVVILGGGDTGSDCLGTAHRQGAASVHQLELMPAPPTERSDGNPWPQWPMVFTTSSSQEEGGERVFALKTTRLTGQDGQVTALHAVQVELVDGVLTEVGGEVTLPADLVILAMGFVSPVAEALHAQLGVALDGRGQVAIDPQTRVTSVPGVFAAGDASRGASLIVWAISDGRETARSVDSYLRADTPTALPSRGNDRPFGGR